MKRAVNFSEKGLKNFILWLNEHLKSPSLYNIEAFLVDALEKTEVFNGQDQCYELSKFLTKDGQPVTFDWSEDDFLLIDILEG